MLRSISFVDRVTTAEMDWRFPDYLSLTDTTLLRSFFVSAINFLQILSQISNVWKRVKAVIYNVTTLQDLPDIPDGSIIIDAIFGSGLSKPIEGFAAEVIRLINDTNSTRIAIDIPSGGCMLISILLYPKRQSSRQITHLLSNILSCHFFC